LKCAVSVVHETGIDPRRRVPESETAGGRLDVPVLPGPLRTAAEGV
jgi:hypothetical protein